MMKPKLSARELEITKGIIRPVVKQMRRHLLRRLKEEKARHWEMRGSHRLGKHFERGFFRGMNHAFAVVSQLTNPALYQAKTRSARKVSK